MRQLGVVGTIFIGFIAGVFFVISCGGGGSNVMAEITDITGIITGLSSIDSSIQGIDGTTDMSGVEAAINGIGTTDVGGIVSELQNIDFTLQEIKLALEPSGASASQSITIFSDVTLGVGTSILSAPIPIEGYSNIEAIYVSDVPAASNWMRYFTTIGGIESAMMGFPAHASGEIVQASIMGESIRFGIKNFGGVQNISLSIRLTN